MILTNYEVNFLLFGTPTIFHNRGLSIYSLKENLVKKHNLEFLNELTNLEKVFVPSIEDRLSIASKNLQEQFNILMLDAKNTAESLVESCAFNAVLFSHINLEENMKPHIHRQAYATSHNKCVTIHYRLTLDNIAEFDYWDTVTQKEVFENNLGCNKEIEKWCDHRLHNTLYLKQNKNIIVFDSGFLPHRVKHSESLNVYFIFDHAILKIKEPTSSIILLE